MFNNHFPVGHRTYEAPPVQVDVFLRLLRADYKLSPSIVPIQARAEPLTHIFLKLLTRHLLELHIPHFLFRESHRRQS
jgi:hypothetical protein